MKKVIFLAAGVLLMNLGLFACGGVNQQVYTGDIRYSFSTANPYECSVIITLNFDIPDNLSTDSIWVQWGDGSASVIWATNVTEDTAAKLTQGIDLFKHVYAGTHIYDSVSADGYYYISLIGQYHLNSINNIASGSASNLPFYVEAKVSIDTSAGFSNQSPTMNPAWVPFAGVNTAFYQNPDAHDADNDSISFDVITPMEYYNSPVPLYETPDYYCQQNGQTGSSFSVDQHTGVLSWNSPCQIGIYAVTTRVREFRNGILLGSTLREQNIYVTTNSTTGIANASLSPDFQVYPNPATNILSGSIPNVSPDLFIEIMSIDGAIALKNIHVNGNHFDADISTLPAGIYFLHVRDANHNYSSKFVKQ